MDNAELLAFAKVYDAGRDLYELLTVDPTAPEDLIRRAWRKTSLKYHPDKAGDAFDPEKWQLFERALEVLSDPTARQTYDTARDAALRREQQRAALDADRRRMIEDLERREKGLPAQGATQQDSIPEAERRRMTEAGLKRMADRKRMEQEAEEREKKREQEAQEADDLKEAKAKIAARKAAKADKKKRGTAADDADQDGRDRKREEKLARRSANTPDADVGAGPAPKSSTAPADATSSSAKPKRSFAETMAALRAAQREKEAKKKQEQATPDDPGSIPPK